MVNINGVSYKGNDLLINNKGTFIDGVEISKCERIPESDETLVTWHNFIFLFFLIWGLYSFFKIFLEVLHRV